jgi:pyridoxal/pyridoxine/pyridoxamine kinase
MGDDGKLYVTAEMVALYREAALPCADVIFPNQTEAEYDTHFDTCHTPRPH